MIGPCPELSLSSRTNPEMPGSGGPRLQCRLGHPEHKNSPVSPKPFSGPPERLCSPHSLFSTPEHHGSKEKVGDFWLNFSWHVSQIQWWLSSAETEGKTQAYLSIPGCVCNRGSLGGRGYLLPCGQNKLYMQQQCRIRQISNTSLLSFLCFPSPSLGSTLVPLMSISSSRACYSLCLSSAESNETQCKPQMRTICGTLKVMVAVLKQRETDKITFNNLLFNLIYPKCCHFNMQSIRKHLMKYFTFFGGCYKNPVCDLYLQRISISNQPHFKCSVAICKYGYHLGQHISISLKFTCLVFPFQ